MITIETSCQHIESDKTLFAYPTCLPIPHVYINYSKLSPFLINYKTATIQIPSWIILLHIFLYVQIRLLMKTYQLNSKVGNKVEQNLNNWHCIHKEYDWGHFILTFTSSHNKKAVKLIGVGIKAAEFGRFHNKGVCLSLLAKIFARWKF